MRGLVVGRFQPLHKGHERLIRSAIEDCVDVVVGIGSSNARRSIQNPFDLEERRRMLEAVFGDAVTVVALPDIHDPPNWVRHVLELTGPVDKVFGNDDRTVALFEDADIPVIRTGLFDREHFEASTVRMQMAEDDPAWRRAVPAKAVEVLEALDGSRRVRLLGVTS